MTPKPQTPDIGPFLETFSRFESALQPSWLLPLRRAGIARFAELGFPTLQDEDWRFTNVAPLARLPLQPVAEPATMPPPKPPWENTYSPICPVPGSFLSMDSTQWRSRPCMDCRMG